MGIAARHGLTVTGTGKHAVVLGHGFGFNQSCWARQIPPLVSAGYRVVTYDMAGATPATECLFNASRHRSLFGFAEDLSEILDDAGITRASYVGHSVAAMVGLLAANGQPGLFTDLILIAASPRYIDDPDTGYVGGFSSGQVEDILAAMRGNYAAWANGFAPLAAGHADRPELAEEFVRSLLALRPDIASATFAAILRSDHRKDAQYNRLPVRLLQTARDAAVPQATAAWLAQAMAARELRLIDTEGHFPHRSAPHAVSAALLEFLAHAST